ncbi:hypothetical protein FR943_26265 [Mycobacterium sp. TNTM28]|uniref:Uncharacterized protein n=1 Tax=[Mycobacterium] fortunisiensis TaxID=2600579 RepID=A0ABS6KUL0_9MYCO|nr:hypothetical protein [[Mycobacterium] fortunisiensis]MBU9767325.1 hypothetical protein [[Mycobacterium] fortunisiensis]
MPDDLLRHVIGPTPYSSVWLWAAIGLILLVCAWYIGVFVLTAPRRAIRELPVLGAARAELLRRRSARAVRTIGNRYRSGDLSAAPAGAAVSRELRAFLQSVTGVQAQYMQVEAIAASDAAAAAPILVELTDIQFNHHSALDAGTVSDATEELIRGWT